MAFLIRWALSSGRSVAEITRAHEVNANQVFDCRRQYQGRLNSTGAGLMPQSQRRRHQKSRHFADVR
ncbi:transposase [Paraburkholderia sp. RAU2J]|nr:transposase [Paraburkholderia sp. RAU2J]